jgi:hypothetical protein
MALPLQYDYMSLPCGGRAYFDVESSTYSYRCELCGAVVGSIGQPQFCKDEMKKYENWAKLGGKDWDYFQEVEYDKF